MIEPLLNDSSSCYQEWDDEERKRIKRSQKLVSLNNNNKDIFYKENIRKGISTIYRPEMYLKLSGIEDLIFELKEYWPDTVKIKSKPKYQNVISLFGYPTYELFIQKSKLTDFLTIVKNQNKEIEFSPLIPCVASILLLYYESDISYFILQSMINQNDKYFVKTKKEFTSILNSIDTLIYLNNKKLYDHSVSIKLNFAVVSLFMMPVLFSTKLNKNVVLTIFDAFIHEGRTVLTRYIIGIILSIESELLKTQSSSEFMNLFFEYLISLHHPSDLEKLIHFTFNLSFMKRNKIYQIEKNEKSKDNFLNELIDNELPNIDDFYNFCYLAKSTKINNSYYGQKKNYESIYKLLYSKINGGKLISCSQFWDLKKKLHSSFIHFNAFPVYRLSEDGSSMIVFFKRAKNISPCMILIQTKSNCIGAVLVNSIQPEYNRKFYGSPLTTIFELANMNSYTYSRKNDYFLSVTRDSVQIGSGKTGSAIYFEDGFQDVVSDECETFNSPPLLSSKREEIVNVELYKLSP